MGNLPLVFVSTLCHDRRAVFYRSLGEECERLGVAYTAFDIGGGPGEEERGGGAEKKGDSGGGSRARCCVLTLPICPFCRPPAAAATLWQFTLGINLIRHSAARAALAASAGQPGTPALSDDEDWPAGGLLPSAARLEKHPTVSDLLQGRRNFSSAANGQQLELWVAPQRCQDGMSGSVQHLSAELRLNGQVMRGCAYYGGAQGD